MSVRAAPLNTAAADLGTAISEVQPEAAALAEGNSFTTQSSETPLTRNIVVSIRASLNDLCLQKSKGSWAPSPEALKSIFQAKKFTSLEGTQEAQGDLKVHTALVSPRHTPTHPHTHTHQLTPCLSLLSVGGPPLDEAAARQVVVPARRRRRDLGRRQRLLLRDGQGLLVHCACRCRVVQRAHAAGG